MTQMHIDNSSSRTADFCTEARRKQWITNSTWKQRGHSKRFRSRNERSSHFIIQRASRHCIRGGGGVTEGGAGVPPPRVPAASASFTPSLFLARVCQPPWNPFLHWRFWSGYIFQFIYTHYQEIARGSSNSSTCNIKPSKSFLVPVFWILNGWHQQSEQMQHWGLSQTNRNCGKTWKRRTFVCKGLIIITLKLENQSQCI